MATELLFRSDAYLPETEATVLAVNDRRGIVLDRTVFYATGGGQPGDTGTLRRAGGDIAIATTVYGEDKAQVVHVPGDAEPLPEPGETLTAALDWERRHRHMRIHTGLHLLSVVLPFPVTGGSIGAGEGRLDFDIDGEVPAKEEIEERLNALIAADYPVSRRMDHRRGTRRQSGPGQDHEGQAADGQRPRAAGQDRRHRPAALRRHPCARHR